MARSLTIQPEDHARTSPLFTGFFLLCVGFLLLGTLLSGDAQAVATDPIVAE